MTTTTQLRNWWAPACTGPFSTISLHGEGRVTVRAAIVPAVAALNACLKAHNYRTRRADTGGYNCRKITGGTGYSLHAFGTAIDVNWSSNPYGPRLVTDMPPAMIADIKALRTRNGKQVWRWGGDYSGSKDGMHFEVTCSPADLATGIASPDHTPAAEPPEDDDMKATLSWLQDPAKPTAGACLYLCAGAVATYVNGSDAVNIAKARGAVIDSSSKTKPHAPAFLKQVHLLDGPLAST